MAETPSQLPPRSGSDSDPLQYWCYQCDKRVSIETTANLPDVICYECKSGFVESIPAPAHPTSEISSGFPDLVDDPNFGSQFLQVLQLIAQAASDGDAPPPPPPQNPPGDDFLRIELDGWDNDEDEEEEEEEEANEVESRNGGEDRVRGTETDEEHRDQQEREEEEEELRRRRRDVLRLRIRDFVTRGRSGRNRILDWAEILMGLDDNSIELRLEMPESDRYIGNPEDYVDATGYEALLQTLAESDGAGRRGAPPASKSAVMELPTVVVGMGDEALVCAICKDTVNVGEMAKRLPCGHRYHGDCIVPWLGSRNSCPVCRFELPTDDPDYEAQRKNKGVRSFAGASGSSGGGNSV
ncbi:43kDa postsynaptic protein [Parasponia andersonii]|uniref:RING-type E3 ubiquitin transferase n=1 Tax=Parasponia andersonii TaxID=3476 RepID=A0A2P5DJD8_PARAD|nr:43kDa postsynaptic protein [Parasponia andersonii]